MTPRRTDAPNAQRRRAASAGRAGGVAALAAAILVAGCSSSPPIRYHALTAVAAQPEARTAYDGPVLAVGSVQVPPSLTRPELVRETATGRFEVREFDHWAAPLPRLARQVLAEDLQSRLPHGKVVYPGAAWPEAGAVLDVDVLSFRLGDGVGTLVLSWSLRQRPAGGAAAGSLRGAQLRLEAPADSGAPESTARVWDTLLGQLADRVVADLAGPAPPK